MVEPITLGRRKHTLVRRWHLSSQNLPDDAANHDSSLTAEHIRQRTGNQSSNERTARHGSDDATLGGRSRTWANTIDYFTLVEIA